MRILLVFGLVASAACGGGAAEPVPPPPLAAAASPVMARTPVPSGPKVAFLGDSISAGLHLPADQAFPAVVREKLAASGQPFQLLNAGVSGDTSAGGLRRIDWLLKQAPAVVVVELGANDAMRGQPIQSIEQNLRAIVEKVQASGAKVLLLGMRIPDSYGPEYAAQFEAMYPKLASDLKLEFVPFFMDGVAGVPELNLADGMHPTREGHRKLAETVTGPLASVLEGR